MARSITPVAVGIRAGLGIAAIAVAVLTIGIPGASAAPIASARGHYADWSIGGNGRGTGTGAIDAAGFPIAAVTSDATALSTPSGTSAFLGEATPIGAEYGSSRGRPYLNISTAGGITTSTTTLDFGTPTPGADWAFALGDVDADIVAITATGAGGTPVATRDLGFAGTFNYCAASPRPGSCTGAGPFTDKPIWHPGSGRLVGNGPDTVGATGWFRPTVPIRTITFAFTARTGSPIFQLWLASLAVPVTTTIAGITPDDPVPAPGVAVDLLGRGGLTPVRNPQGIPVEAIATDTGVVDFPAVVDGDYVLKIVPPPRTHATGATTITVTVDVRQGPPRIPSGSFRLVVPRQLAVTGSAAAPAAAAGALLVALGILLVRLRPATRRSSTTRSRRLTIRRMGTER